MNKLLKLIISIIISTLGLYYAFGEVNIEELWLSLKSTNLIYIVLASSLIIFSILIRAQRWKLLLEPIKVIPLNPLFGTTMIGYFGNAVLPFRAGELLRAYSIASLKNINTSAAFGTILLERILDLIGLVFTMIIFSWFYPFESGGKSIMILIMLLTISGFTFIIWLGSNHLQIIEKIKRRPFFKGPLSIKILKIISNLVEGLTSIRDTNHSIKIIFYTIFMWFIYFCVTFAVILGTGINLDWIGVGIILVSTSFALAVPAAPGGIGTYHAAAVYMLTSYFAVNRIESQAFAVILHAVGYIPLMLIGFIYFIRSSVHFKDISEKNITK